MLGHANLAQTSTYLNATTRGLHDSMRRFGTTTLHGLAPKPSVDNPRSVQQEVSDEAQPTVN